jgi:hypothetical protein
LKPSDRSVSTNVAPTAPPKPKPTDIQILYNVELMTAEEEQSDKGIGLAPDELLEAARLVIDLEKSLIVFVTDGHTVHTITLTGYDLRNDTFEYHDPRGNSSFLESKYNIAGVNAVRSMTQARSWIVKSNELGRVLHALIAFDRRAQLVALQEVRANPSRARFGRLGETLDSALKTDLFTWFHFEQASVEKDAEGRDVFRFKPSGSKFHDLAMLTITCDAARKLVSAEVLIKRSFVDDQANGVFAADLANSFLRQATSMNDLTVIAPLITEIEETGFHGRTVIRAAGTGVQRPRPNSPSGGSLVYAGKQPTFDSPLSSTSLTLENRGAAGDAALLMTIR